MDGTWRWRRLVWTGLLAVATTAGWSATTGADGPAPLAIRDGEWLITGLVTGADHTTGTVVVKLHWLQPAGSSPVPLLPAEPATLLLPVTLPTVDHGRIRTGQVIALTVTPTATRPWRVRALAVTDREGEFVYRTDLAPGPLGIAYPYVTTTRKAVVPMVFPVLGQVAWRDTFRHIVRGIPHLGQDLVAARMTPLLACFDGTVTVRRAQDARRANSVIIFGDNGWTAVYTHLNNDTPGTADNRGRDRWAFAPGLRDGLRVRGGQLLGWLGDSGVASGPHLHFELRSGTSGTAYNPAASLRHARRLSAPVTPPRLPEPAPSAGYVRVDGVIAGVDTARKVVAVSVLTRQVPGRTRVLNQPHTTYVVFGKHPGLILNGTDQMIPLAALRAGDAVALLGVLAGSRLTLAAGRVELPGLLPGEGLRSAFGLRS